MANALAWMVVLFTTVMTCRVAAEDIVDIWNYVGEPISVHCRDQFTDKGQIQVDHTKDYVFTLQPNKEGTTQYVCSFIWALNRTQEFPVWKGSSYTDRNPCSDPGPCLYKVTQTGFYVYTKNIALQGQSTWRIFKKWIIP